MDVGIGVGEQLPDQVLGDVVVALAELDVANGPVRVDQILGRPVAVAVVRPRRQIVVERDRVGDAQIGRAADHVALDLLERVLGAVHPDDLQSRILVLVVPVDDVRNGALAVDA